MAVDLKSQEVRLTEVQVQIVLEGIPPGGLKLN